MIPKDWTKTTIGKIANLVTSGSRGWAEYYSDNGDYFIRITNLRRENIRPDFSKMKYVQLPMNGNEGQRTRLKSDDILISITADLGTIGFIDEELDRPSYINQHIALVRLVKSKANPKFVAYQLASKSHHEKFQKLNDAGAKAGLNLPTIKSVTISLPPLTEQKRIAELLSTWDRAIETTEKLIANSEAQKKALMQQLVSGEMRFPEISAEPWNELNLNDVASTIVSNVDKKTVDDEQTVRLCNYMDVYANDVVHPDLPYMSATATVAQVRKFGLRVGDVLITKDSETPDDIAVPTYVERTADDLVCGYHLAIIRPKKGVSGRFLKYFFENPRTQYYFASRANGATRFGLTIGAIEDAPIQLPPLPEQEKIASAIAGSEREARVLASSLNALLTEKKALMQQLLTGKRRVKIKKKEAA